MAIFKKTKCDRGFTLIHLILIIIALSIAAGVAAKLISQSIYQSRINRTLKKIQIIQHAIFGEYRLRDQTSFCYVGDMGELPKKLDDLIKKPGGGKSSPWNGPYIISDFLEDDSDPFLDAWGNPIMYDGSTGQLGISTDSIGDDQIVIPKQFENIDDILLGGIEGIIRDSNGGSPPKGHRRHIFISMEPIYTEPWPEIAVDLEMDKEMFHMHRMWSLHHTIRDGIDIFNDHIDVGRRHWIDKPSKNYWRWLPEGIQFDIYDDNYDDHETEWDSLGTRNTFDPHFEDFWDDYSYSNQNVTVYEQIKVFIHPDRFGSYSAENIPVRPYIITCYHDLYEISIKQYVIIKPDFIKKLSFRFPVVFPQLN